MSRSISQVAALRRLARVYRRILVLGIPATLAGCQSAGEPLAPDAAFDSPASAGAAATAEVVPSSGVVGSLVSDRIVFASFAPIFGADIWTMGPQGGNQAQLTGFSGIETDPSWSYDHKRIAFVRFRGNVPDIYVMNTDGTNKHWARPTAYPHTIDQPSWSPDGSHLLVRVAFDGDVSLLAKLDLGTGNMTLLAPAGAFGLEGNNPIYDQAGKTIFYVDGSLKTIKRFTPGGALTSVLSSTGEISDLAISPDGGRLAYTVGGVNAYKGEIYVLNLATKVTKRLTFNSANDYSPTWSPDGTRLAFASGRTGKLQIYTMNSSTGGGLTKITDRPNGAGTPAWLR